VSGDAQQREQLELIASCDGAPALLRQVAAACSSRAPTPAELVSLTLAKPPSGWLPPRFAEALVATAIGLFAAIPAVVAYNRFSYDIERLSNRFDTFVEEFSNILQRQAARS
jgi:hypothetical protein